MWLRLLLPVLLLLAPIARAEDAVDLALVLAVDASASVNGDIARLQLKGHAAALRAPEVADAIAGGPKGAIAVSLVAWAAPGQFTVLAPWTTLTGAEEAKALADRIEALPPAGFEGATGIGSALTAAAALFETAPPAPRRLIDISSNGFSNVGPQPKDVREALKSQRIGVNALVLLDEYDWLPGYFRDNVVTGPGAFVRIATGPVSYRQALIAKLVIEIAGLSPLRNRGG